MMWFSVCTCFLIKPVANIGFVMYVPVYVRLSTSSSSIFTRRLFAKILYRGVFINIFRRIQLSLKSKNIKITDTVLEDLLTFMTAWWKRLPFGVGGHKNYKRSFDSCYYAKALEFLSLCMHFGRLHLVTSVFYYWFVRCNVPSIH